MGKTGGNDPGGAGRAERQSVCAGAGPQRGFDGSFYRQTIYEKNADERRSPASITKIMTLILIFDAIDVGKIRLM